MDNQKLNSHHPASATHNKCCGILLCCGDNGNDNGATKQLTDGGSFDKGFERGKKESLVIIRTMSEDMNRAEKDSNELRKELKSLKRVIESYEKNINEYKKKSIERVKEVERVVGKSGVIGEEMRALKGNYSLTELIIACVLTATVLVCMMLAVTGSGRNLLFGGTVCILLLFFGSLGLEY
mgnify:CR=1 FL=1